MMKVIEQKMEKKTALFEDLKIGDVYRDENGLVCIKVSNKDRSTECNSLTYAMTEEGHWERTFEAYDAEVEPLETDLVIK